MTRIDSVRLQILLLLLFILLAKQSWATTPAQEVANAMSACHNTLHHTGLLWHRSGDTRGTLGAVANAVPSSSTHSLPLNQRISPQTEARLEASIRATTIRRTVQSLVIAHLLYPAARNGFPIFSRSDGHLFFNGVTSDQGIAQWILRNYFANATSWLPLIQSAIRDAKLEWQARQARPLTAAQSATEILSFATQFNAQCRQASQTPRTEENLSPSLLSFLQQHPQYQHLFVTANFRRNIFSLQSNYNQDCGNVRVWGQNALLGAQLPGFKRENAAYYQRQLQTSFAQAQNDLAQYLRDLVSRSHQAHNATNIRKNIYSFIKEQPELMGQVIQQSPAQLRQPYSVLLCQRFRDILDADFWRTIAVSTVAGGAIAAASIFTGGLGGGLVSALMIDTVAGVAAIGGEASLNYAVSAQMARAQALNASSARADSVMSRAAAVGIQERSVGEHAPITVLAAPVVGQAVRAIPRVGSALARGIRPATPVTSTLGEDLLALAARSRSQDTRELLERSAQELSASHATPPGKILKFEGISDKDAYNITSPFVTRFENAEVEVIAARVESRHSEQDSVVMFFRKLTREGQEVWVPLEGLRPMHLQDPFYTHIGDELVFGGVQLVEENGRIVSYYTSFYRGRSLDTLTHFANGPVGMKDIRLVSLANGKIGVFTRPQGPPGSREWRGKIGYTEIATLDDLKNIDLINSAPLIRNLERFFGNAVWGGVNAAYPRADGRINVLAHLAYWTDEGAPTAARNYYSATFIFDPQTKNASNLRIAATRAMLPEGPSKRADLQNVLFSGGLLRRLGRYLLCGGAGDAQGFCLEIADPFSE